MYFICCVVQLVSVIYPFQNCGLIKVYFGFFLHSSLSYYSWWASSLPELLEMEFYVIPILIVTKEL